MPPTLRADIRNRLEEFGITWESLFPDLTGIAKDCLRVVKKKKAVGELEPRQSG